MSLSLGLHDVPGDVILVSLVGSRAYGTHHADSDFDYRGVFKVPTAMLFGLADTPDTFSGEGAPDVVMHEVRKFCKLAAAGNPSIMEVLWGRPVVRTWHGQMLRDNRDAFLSRRLVNTYGGYAQQQLRKARDGTGGSRGQRHYQREKFILNIYRLMECGIHVVATGEFKLKVEDPERLWAQARQDLDVVAEDFARLDDKLKIAAMGSPLPDLPDIERIDAMLRAIREEAKPLKYRQPQGALG